MLPAPGPASTPNDEPIVLRPDPVLAPLLPRFLARRHQELAAIDRELEQDGFTTLEGIGHNLKGTGRGYGCDGISEIGEVLERAAQQRDAVCIRKLRTALAEYLGRIQIMAANGGPESR